jgi:hypothetical protein
MSGVNANGGGHWAFGELAGQTRDQYGLGCTASKTSGYS